MNDTDRLDWIDSLGEERHDLLPVLVAGCGVGSIQERRQLGGHLAGEVEHHPRADAFLAVNEPLGSELESLTKA